MDNARWFIVSYRKGPSGPYDRSVESAFQSLIDVGVWLESDPDLARAIERGVRLDGLFWAVEDRDGNRADKGLFVGLDLP
jgi:hypothetical protein